MAPRQVIALREVMYQVSERVLSPTSSLPLVRCVLLNTPSSPHRCCSLSPQLSPYQQSVVGQAFKNAPKTFLHFLQQVCTCIHACAPGRV